MSLAAPWALLALLSLPAIVALHLWRRRLVERRVAGLFLWAEEAAAAPAGRRRTPLRGSASLLLELLAAAALSLLLAGPRFGTDSAPQLVVVLDDSASMGANAPAGRPADRARLVAAQALSELGDEAQVTVILTGARAEIVAGPRAPGSTLQAALEDWDPVQPGHDPAAALDLARQLAGPADRILFLTDDPAQSVPPEVSLQAVGVPLQNAAITAARRVPAADGEQLYVDVTGHGDRALATTLRVIDETSGALLGELAVGAEARSTAHLILGLPGTHGALRLRLAPDALPLDGDVLLLPEPPPTVLACDLLPADVSRALAVERVLSVLDGVARGSDPRSAQLVIATEPGTLADGRVELVLAGPVEGSASASFLGPFLLDRRHPLMAGLTLQGVVWTTGAGSAPGMPLVVAGARPLVACEEAGDSLRITLDLDPARSNLAASPDWPILASNLVEAARARRPGLAGCNVRVGEEIGWRRETSLRADARHELVGPDGSRREARGLRELAWVAQRPGLYRIEVEGELGAEVAVRFEDAGESDLSLRGSGSHAASVAPGGLAAGLHGGSRATSVLAGLLLAALAADWLVLRRRPRA